MLPPSCFYDIMDFVNTSRKEYRYYLGGYVVHLPHPLPSFDIDDDLCPPLGSFLDDYINREIDDGNYDHIIPYLIISYNNLQWYECPEDEEPCFDDYDDDMPCRDAYIESLMDDADVDDIFTLTYSEARMVLKSNTSLIPEVLDVIDIADAAGILGDTAFEWILEKFLPSA
jgi:hypothetical protein